MNGGEAASGSADAEGSRTILDPADLVSGGGGIRTHESFRTPVFKLGEAFCVWLRWAAFSRAFVGFWADSADSFSI